MTTNAGPIGLDGLSSAPSAATPPERPRNATPNRGQWVEGNQAAVRHGARSKRLRAENRAKLAAGLREHVQTLLPDLLPQDSLIVDMLIDCLADVRQLRDYVDAQGGPVSTTGRTYKPLEMLRARERDASGFLRDLGVGPKARAGLVATLGNRRTGLSTQLAMERRRLEAAGLMSPLQ